MIVNSNYTDVSKKDRRVIAITISEEAHFIVQGFIKGKRQDFILPFTLPYIFTGTLKITRKIKTNLNEAQ